MNVRSEEFGLSFDSSEFLPILPLDLAFVAFEFFICLFFQGRENISCKRKFLKVFFKSLLYLFHRKTFF